MNRQRLLLCVLGMGVLLAGGCRHATLKVGEQTIVSGDGLGLAFNLTGKLVAVSLDDKELPEPLLKLVPLTDTGFFVHEAGSFFGREPLILGQVKKQDDRLSVSGEPIGITLAADFISQPGGIVLEGTLANRRKGERRITVGLSLPVNASGWLFGRSPLESDLISKLDRYSDWVTATDGGGELKVNRMMFTPIYIESAGIAVGAAPDHPQPFRVSYKQEEGLTLEADMDLASADVENAGRASFKFVIFRFDPAGGYRAALAKYYRVAAGDYLKFQSGVPGVSATRPVASPKKVENLLVWRALMGPTAVGQVDIGGTEPRQYTPRELEQFERDLNVLLPYGFVATDFKPAELAHKYCDTAREMAAAGWEPVHGVVVANKVLLVERYGGAGDAKVFYAVHNRGEKEVDYEMDIDLLRAGLDPGSVKALNRLTGQRPVASITEKHLQLKSRLAPGRSDLFELASSGRPPATTQPGTD